MLIALLALFGVDLIVLVVLAAPVFTRKRWITHGEDGAALVGPYRMPPAGATVSAASTPIAAAASREKQ
jgi:hypothetical protein